MTNNERLVGWLEQTVRRDYVGKVALVCLYGSYVNGTANPRSDVDCYFVSKTEAGMALARTFLLDGVGYDIFPMSWQRLEAIAGLESALLPLVGDVRVLYADTPADLARLEDLQRRLRANLADRNHRLNTAKQRFNAACRHLPRAEDDLRTARYHAGRLLMELAEALAFREGTYYHFGLKKQFSDLQRLHDLPENFVQSYLSVLKAKNTAEITTACHRLLESVGWPVTPAERPQMEKTSLGGQELAGLYEEISSTFNKIYVCCEKNHPVLAYLSAVCLQGELPWLDVLSAYRFGDLAPLAYQARRAEQQVRDTIRDTGGLLHQYATFEDFEKAQK